jgi:uncharacterized protein YgbK (DUF1537 family)
LGAIADDVTGASDLCSTLAGEGLRTVQTIGIARGTEIAEVDALVVALKSRTAPISQAVAEATEALRWLRELGAGQFFFKYCSTFDSTPVGNIGPVADALLDQLGATTTVVCPAYPANARTVYQGHLFVGDRLLSESSMARHPLTPMTDPDLVRHLSHQTSRPVGLVPYEVVRKGSEAIAARLGELAKAGVTYAVTDALVDADLRSIGTACADLRLVTGGSGMALGLPENFRRRGQLRAGVERIEVPAPEGPTIVLAGSCSTATRAQVSRMSDRYPAIKLNVLDVHADPGALGLVTRQAETLLAEGPVLVYTTAPPDEVARVQKLIGTDRANELVESGLGELARRLVEKGARRVVVAGGETAAGVVRALGVRALATGHEIAPGVPWMISLSDPPLALALKSGNFGGPDFFLQALGVTT